MLVHGTPCGLYEQSLEVDGFGIATREPSTPCSGGGYMTAVDHDERTDSSGFRNRLPQPFRACSDSGDCRGRS